MTTVKKAVKKKAPARNKKTKAEPEVELPLPTGPRRVVFIDVENTSSEGDLVRVLDELKIDLTGGTTEIAAIGNWRVVGQHLGRTLAERGAHLVHSAPAARVADWSDLWIAVQAGIWLGRSRPGDSLDIVSHDRAFDAVGDAAVRLGVAFQRITYRAVSERGGEARAMRAARAPGEPRGKPSGARRTGRGAASRAAGAAPRPSAVAAAAPHQRRDPQETAWPSETGAPEAGTAHGATQDELREAIARLAAADPSRAVTLDTLTAALKLAGFQRPPGSPRLVTRLRALAGVEVLPNGTVRLASEGTAPGASVGVPAAAPAPSGDGSRRRRRRGGRGR